MMRQCCDNVQRPELIKSFWSVTRLLQIQKSQNFRILLFAFSSWLMSYKPGKTVTLISDQKTIQRLF